jgi:hypothetical protein
VQLISLPLLSLTPDVAGCPISIIIDEDVVAARSEGSTENPFYGLEDLFHVSTHTTSLHDFFKDDVMVAWPWDDGGTSSDEEETIE